MNYPGWEYERFVCENFLFKAALEGEDFERQCEVIDLFADYFMKTYTAVCRVDGKTMRAWFKRCLSNPVNLYDFAMDSPPWKEARDELSRLQDEAMAKFCEEAGINVNRDILLIMARDEGLVRGKIVVAPDEDFSREFAED